MIFPCYDIYKMNTNENITIYILSKIYGPEFDYLIIGKRADGKFVKYIDTREITKRYLVGICKVLLQQCIKI